MAGADCRRLGTVPSGGAFGACGLPVDGGLNAALDRLRVEPQPPPQDRFDGNAGIGGAVAPGQREPGVLRT